MSELLLVWTPLAVSIAAVHTLSGPDHYLPFIAMSKAGRWGWSKTVWVTSLCGLGHVISSIALALLGSAALVGSERLLGIESVRGDLAAWGLIAFGLVYAVWGFRNARRRRSHRHAHVHEDGVVHEHPHEHTGAHTHAHESAAGRRLTPWVLFTIFIFGPCEPLIPLVMYPAAKHNIEGVILVTLAFGLTTIATMLVIIAISSWGISFLRLGKLERYVHALAGAMIFISGLSVQFLGL